MTDDLLIRAKYHVRVLVETHRFMFTVLEVNFISRTSIERQNA